MKKMIRLVPTASYALAALICASPTIASEASKPDSSKDSKAPHKLDHSGHDHGEHEGHEKHDEKIEGMGKTDIKDISMTLHEKLACLDKEIASHDHGVLHSCLAAVEALGQDLINLKVPADPAKKKRVNGYAKNLGMMAHKIDEYKDAKALDKAKDQLGKLKAQVEMILKQFPELANHDKPAMKKETPAKETPGHEGHGH